MFVSFKVIAFQGHWYIIKKLIEIWFETHRHRREGHCPNDLALTKEMHMKLCQGILSSTGVISL